MFRPAQVQVAFRYARPSPNLLPKHAADKQYGMVGK